MSVEDCSCRECLRQSGKLENGLPIEYARMIVCDICGNKRCPHANNHTNACTRSNALGQIGSAFA